MGCEIQYALVRIAENREGIFMAKEIAYIEVRKGIFEPVLTSSQRRKLKREIDKATEAKNERIASIIMAMFLAICFAGYVLAQIIMVKSMQDGLYAAGTLIGKLIKL